MNFVIHGGSGDLAHRKLLSALCDALVNNQLPAVFVTIGATRESLDDNTYRRRIETGARAVQSDAAAGEALRRLPAIVRY